MILPKALALGAQLLMPVAAGDGVPNLNVEQVCEGIAKQGGVTFHDPAIAQEKKNCLDSEQAIRDELVKQWSSFSAERPHALRQRIGDGRRFKLHRADHLPGDGARRTGDARAAGGSARRYKAAETEVTRTRAASALMTKFSSAKRSASASGCRQQPIRTTPVSLLKLPGRERLAHALAHHDQWRQPCRHPQ